MDHTGRTGTWRWLVTTLNGMGALYRRAAQWLSGEYGVPFPSKGKNLQKFDIFFVTEWERYSRAAQWLSGEHGVVPFPLAKERICRNSTFFRLEKVRTEN